MIVIALAELSKKAILCMSCHAIVEAHLSLEKAFPTWTNSSCCCGGVKVVVLYIFCSSPLFTVPWWYGS